MRIKRILALLMSVAIVLGAMPMVVASAEEGEIYRTEYVKVSSVDEIVPDARYIIVGTYTDDNGEVSYHAMGKKNNSYDGFRYSYAQDQDGAHNFDISEDKSTITVYTYATYDPILRVRISPRDDEGRFYLKVDGEGYLCGYSDSTSDGANGHDLHSCMPIDDYTVGELWWYMRVAEEGDYAGDWQIVNRSRLGNRTGYYYDVIRMGRPYPNSAGQFRAEPVGREDVGELDENEFIKYTTDADTNILLYREVCSHRAEEVTHREAVEATCEKPGVLEYWYCAGCSQYFSDEDLSNSTTLNGAVIAPPAHKFDLSGICTVCGVSENTMTFVEYEDSSYSSDMDGEQFIFVGFKDGKAYVMGNTTYADGSREAVEIPIKANGAIDISSAIAEFFTFDFNVPTGGTTFSPDGGYMSMLGGKIIVYDKSLVNEPGLPEPIRFGRDDYYQSKGYFYNWSNDEYIVFDSDTLTFKVSDVPVDSIVLYKQVCAHTNIMYTPGAEATCTEQGAIEYWYCDECYCYYMNNDFETPVEIYDVSELMMRATGHHYVDDVCENCGMKRPVYTQISTLAEFDALNKNSSYIMVVKDGEKTYAAFTPSRNYPFDIDSDGDGIVDIMEDDINANGIPDCIESYIDIYWGSVDYDENGITTAEEYNEAIGYMNDDDVIDIEDYKLFFEYNIYWELLYQYEEQAYAAPNFVEVTISADGSITIVDEGAMEFQMMESGVWGNQPNEDWMLEEYGIKETDRLRAAWIPNYWIGASGMMGLYGTEHFMTMERYYGDSEYPGIIDHKNWKISFNADGTACLVNTWESFDDTGALQFVKYYDELGELKMTFFGTPDWLWSDSFIMSNSVEVLPVYLYASEPVYTGHVCEFGQWVSDNESTHTRICNDTSCGATETEAHNWNDGVITMEPTVFDEGEITYTCVVCNETKKETIAKLEGVDEIIASGGDVKLSVDEGSTAVIDPNTVLIAEEIPDPSFADETNAFIVEQLGEGVGIISAYDISMLLHGAEVQPGGTITITLPLPEGFDDYDSVQVVYIDDVGNVFICETVVNADGTVSFKTDHFSMYAIVGISDSVFEIGDIDGDGKINSVDLFKLKLFVKQISVPDKSESFAADVNGDSKINSVDIFYLKLRILKGTWSFE